MLSVGNLVRFTNAYNQVVRYEYNLARQKKAEKLFPTLDETTPSRLISYTRNFRGDLLGYSDGETVKTLTVDAAGRTLQSSTNFGPFTKSHSYTYLGNGLRSSYTAADGVTFQYVWDGANNLQNIVVPDEGPVTWNYVPDFPSQPARIIYPGGASQEYTYDAEGHRVSKEAQDGKTYFSYTSVRPSCPT